MSVRLRFTLTVAALLSACGIQDASIETERPLLTFRGALSSRTLELSQDPSGAQAKQYPNPNGITEMRAYADNKGNVRVFCNIGESSAPCGATPFTSLIEAPRTGQYQLKLVDIFNRKLASKAVTECAAPSPIPGELGEMGETQVSFAALGACEQVRARAGSAPTASDTGAAAPQKPDSQGAEFSDDDSTTAPPAASDPGTAGSTPGKDTDGAVGGEGGATPDDTGDGDTGGEQGNPGNSDTHCFDGVHALMPTVCAAAQAEYNRLGVAATVDCTNLDEMPDVDQTPPATDPSKPMCMLSFDTTASLDTYRTQHPECAVETARAAGTWRWVIALAAGYQGACRLDPIVLDLDGDGIALSSELDGPLFDTTGSGRLTQTAWPVNDGLLAFDLDGDGRISSMRELVSDRFGDALYEDGVAALQRFDADGNGRVDSADPSYGQLSVWRDANRDGVTQPGELLSLSRAGVASLTVKFVTAATPLDAFGNTLPKVGSFTRLDGRTGQMADATFRTREVSAAALVCR